MSFHALYVCRLANELNQLLQGATLLQVFSTEKNHLFIHFELVNKQHLNLSFRVEGDAMYLYFPEEEPAKSRLALDQFKPAWNMEVKAVRAHPGERSFHLDLGRASLLFLCYGRHANVLFLKGDEVQPFRTKSMNKSGFPESRLKELVEAKWPENAEAFFASSFITPVLKKNFAATERAEAAYADLLDAYLKGPVYLNKEAGHYAFDAVPGKEVLSSYPSLHDALNPFTELQLGLHFFTQRKEALLRDLNNEASSCEKKLKALEKQMAQLNAEKNYRHLGDLILSNLPAIKEGMTSVDLIDYLDGRLIRIPLREKLSPQDNAQRFYKKAKNQHLQEARLKEEVSRLESRYLAVAEKSEAVRSASTMRDLRIHIKEKKKQPDQVVRLPYHRFTFQDFDILVGKQAKDNDELTLKIAKKDDLWLHARDVSGSHVVVRKRGMLPFPEPVLMAAAGLALWFSKRRNEALAPVIYTEKKYVRKRKGDAAGAVVVEKEKVLMAAPLSPDQF
ncbi:MAG: NFACT RNA binding domain-containing protein [Bacteroidia bacterium]